jgi:hypothetical protein
LNLKDIAIAIVSMIDYEKLIENMRQLAEQLKGMEYELTPSKYEDTSWMWLWRKCGGIFHGAKTVCTAGCYYDAGSKIEMGRQRSTLPGTGKATMGAEEMEYEES